LHAGTTYELLEGRGLPGAPVSMVDLPLAA
jgi:hypothetical protein